jgi:hypothetical protein
MGKWNKQPPHNSLSLAAPAQKIEQDINAVEQALIQEEVALEVLLQELAQAELAGSSNTFIPGEILPLLPYAPFIPPIPPIPGLPESEPPFDLSVHCNTVTGKGLPGSLITVTFPDGSASTAQVDDGGDWLVPVPPVLILQNGETVTATQITPNHNSSSPLAAEVDLGRVLIGYVSPIVYDDHGYGPDFLNLFTTIAQLRDPITCAPIASTTVTPIAATGTGQFCFTNVPAGDYILYLLRPGYLARTLAVHAPTSIGTTEIAPPDASIFTLIGGDLNNDNIITLADRSAILSAMYQTYPGYGGYSAGFDLNADGIIDLLDRNIVFDNMYSGSNGYSGNAGCYQATSASSQANVN